MTLSEHFFLLFVILFVQKHLYADGSVLPDKRVNNDTKVENWSLGSSGFGRSFFGGEEERNLELEIVRELNHLSVRKQREIFDDLEKQRKQLNVTPKSVVLTEPENLSPLNVEELKTIRKTIKTSNSSLPAIRNKRTLNFLLSVVARAMGYTLTPTNPDAEWIPRQRPQQPPPCPTTPPPCRPNPPPSPSPPPCAMPPTAPPCGGSGMQAAMQPATIPPNQIDANTISYPFRPARTIPLLNFAPLPQGVRVPYPPLFQPPAQRSPCAPPQPTQPPCGATPAPCTTPAPSPPPCGTTPAPRPPPCATPAPPPCATTPAPRPPPCGTPAPPPPPCATPAPSPPPCSTPAPPPPPCTTPAPRPPPCATPAPSPPPCATPAPPPPPCGTPPPPPPPPPPSQQPPKKGSILLEYDDPVRIQIFSNDKKYLPASGNIYSGHDDGYNEKTHSYFYPSHEENRRKEQDIEEEEEMQEEHLEAEEEEDDAAPEKQEEGRLKYYEEEDERSQANNEEDESETNLSVVKKPLSIDLQKKRGQRLATSKNKNNEKDVKDEKTVKMKKPKRKKWVRIVKKQRKKTKTDSTPQENFHVFTSDSIPESSYISQRVYGRSVPRHSYDSFEDDISDYADSSNESAENVTKIELKKVIINGKEITSPEIGSGSRPYEININPYATETEEARREKLEKAVERYVEDYVEKQLGAELIKNTGVPKTTVFEFTPKNGPKIQTITTTVAKTSHNGNPARYTPQLRPETRLHYGAPKYPNGGQTGNARVVKKNSYEENFNKRGNSYEAFATRS